MKKTFKSIIAVTLCLIMLIGTIAIGGDGFAEVLEAISVKASADSYSVGDYIYYGIYPQTEVTDETTITALNNCSGTWVSYGYYSGSGSNTDGQMVASDYMRYKDVSYNGSKYRAVTFDSYRPEYTGYTSSADNSGQDDNGYITGNVYWFKYEPIKWRVLDPSTGLVMCATVIDSQAYNNYILYSSSNYYGDADCTYYPNNYAESSIRAWLNNDFYNTAFSAGQKANILTTILDNSAFSTSRSAYDSASTSDKVYLLSWNDVLNSSYGFSTSTSTYDTARQLKGSDYAKAQGLYVYSSSGSTYDGCSNWHLRSAGYYSYGACYVYFDGSVGTGHYTHDTIGGVVPALNLQNLKSDYSGSEIDNSNIYNLGEETFSFGNFGYTKHDKEAYGCSKSHKGHCFGMTVVNSGFYLGNLSKGESRGITTYEMPCNDTIKSIICFYQSKQGSAAQKAIVAGDSYCKPFRGSVISRIYTNIESDWDEVINYVNSHNYDNKGSLMVDLLFYPDGVNFNKYEPHAVNFLYYEKVGSKDRVYIYDSIYPYCKCYFQKNANEYVHEYSEYDVDLGTVSSIGLTDIEKYFENVINLDTSDMIFAPVGTITIEGAAEYPVRSSSDEEFYESFEMSKETTQITIKPLKDNAEFEYMGETYSFGNINEDTYATLTLATGETSSGEAAGVEFSIKNAPLSEASISLPTSAKSIDYRNHLKLTATANNLPDGYYIQWYEGTKTIGDKEATITTDELKSDTSFTAKIVDENGNVVSDSTQEQTVKVTVNAGFFKKLIAFFRGLFGSNPTVSL